MALLFQRFIFLHSKKTFIFIIAHFVKCLLIGNACSMRSNTNVFSHSLSSLCCLTCCCARVDKMHACELCILFVIIACAKLNTKSQWTPRARWTKIYNLFFLLFLFSISIYEQITNGRALIDDADLRCSCSERERHLKLKKINWSALPLAAAHLSPNLALCANFCRSLTRTRSKNAGNDMKKFWVGQFWVTLIMVSSDLIKKIFSHQKVIDLQSCLTVIG